jgi:putative DNA primase/helicase
MPDPAPAETQSQGTADGDPASDPSPFPGAAGRPCYVVLDDWHEWRGAKYRPGVWHCGKDENYGHAGREFLQRLTRDKRDFCALLETAKARPLFATEGTEEQDKRAAARFALIGLAGELATEYGLTGWTEGAAMNAAAESFRLWRQLRGRGNDERRQIAERVSAFIDRHGDGRFSDMAGGGDSVIRDRAGWWRDEAGGREYLFTAEAMRETLKGFDFKRARDVLQQAGALAAPGADGKRARFFRIGGRGVKLYPINADKLDGGEHGP